MSPRTRERIEHVTSTNVRSYWPTILCPFMVSVKRVNAKFFKGKRGVLWEMSGPGDGQMANIMRSNYQNQSHLAARLRGMK